MIELETLAGEFSLLFFHIFSIKVFLLFSLIFGLLTGLLTDVNFIPVLSFMHLIVCCDQNLKHSGKSLNRRQLHSCFPCFSFSLMHLIAQVRCLCMSFDFHFRPSK